MSEMDDMLLREKLSRMPAEAPERCLFVDHAWTQWGPYIPVDPQLAPVSHVPLKPDPRPTPILAYRRRVCSRCGTTEDEDYQQVRQIVADPYDIEKRIKRT